MNIVWIIKKKVLSLLRKLRLKFINHINSFYYDKDNNKRYAPANRHHSTFFKKYADPQKQESYYKL